MVKGGKSRRRFARREVNLLASVRVHGRVLGAVAENISVGGAFLRVELPETTEASLEASLEALIELPHGKGLRVRARVCWRRSNPSGVGLRFEHFLER